MKKFLTAMLLLVTFAIAVPDSVDARHSSEASNLIFVASKQKARRDFSTG